MYVCRHRSNLKPKGKKPVFHDKANKCFWCKTCTWLYDLLWFFHLSLIITLQKTQTSNRCEESWKKLVQHIETIDQAAIHHAWSRLSIPFRHEANDYLGGSTASKHKMSQMALATPPSLLERRSARERERGGLLISSKRKSKLSWMERESASKLATETGQ